MLCFSVTAGQVKVNPIPLSQKVTAFKGTTSSIFFFSVTYASGLITYW